MQYSQERHSLTPVGFWSMIYALEASCAHQSASQWTQLSDAYDPKLSFLYISGQLRKKLTRKQSTNRIVENMFKQHIP